MQTYEYFKSVFMPFAYTSTKYIPDIPYQGIRGRAFGTGQDMDYSVPAGGVVEALLVSPCLYTAVFDSSVSELVTFYSNVNPTNTGLIYSRYGLTSDSMSMTSANSVAMYLHKACGYIYASAPVTYEACMYVKTLANNAENPDTMFSLHSTQTGSIATTDKLWINALPTYFEKRSFDSNNDTYRPGVSVHYLIRIRNNSASSINVYVRGSNAYTVGEREGITIDDGVWAIKSSPLGFTQYVLEKLRFKHCIMVLNNANATAVAAKKAQIEDDVKTAIKELAQNWYDMIKAVPGVDLNKLINFIIFYLE